MPFFCSKFCAQKSVRAYSLALLNDAACYDYYYIIIIIIFSPPAQTQQAEDIANKQCDHSVVICT